MKLNIEPSASFGEARAIEVDDGVGDCDALLVAVGTALGKACTEVFVWDDYFEEFALLVDIGELTDVLEEAGSAKVQVTVAAGGAAPAAAKPAAKPPPKPSASSPKPKVNQAELDDILAASDSDFSSDDDDAKPTLAEAMQPAPKPAPKKPAAPSPRPAAKLPASPRKPAPKPAAKPAPKPAAKPSSPAPAPEPSPPPSPPLDQPPAGVAPKPTAKPAAKPAPKPVAKPAPKPAAAPAPVAATPVRPVMASSAPPPSPDVSTLSKKPVEVEEDEGKLFGQINPEELKQLLKVGGSSESAEVIDASAIVEQERLHRKTSAAGSQVVLVEPKTAIGDVITTPTTRRDAGMPTCMEVRSRWIVIGMSHGTVLVFNHFGGLEQTVDLGIAQPVTSVDVSIPSEEFLVAAYGDGTIAFWDLDAEKIKLKVEGSKRGAPHSDPVIVSHFLPGTPTVITIDTTGKVNKTLFVNQRVRWTNQTKDIFDGSLGRFTAAQVLPPSAAREPTNHMFLTALSSKDAVLVMTLEPTVKQCFEQKRPPGVREGSLPFLSWRPDLRRGKNAFKQNGDPMLVIAWGKEILLLQAMLSWLMMEDDPDEAEIQLIPKGSYTNDCEIQLVTWLNPQVFVFIDTEWQMRVFDPTRLEVMESTEMRSLGLVSHNYFSANSEEDGGDGGEEEDASFHHSITFCDEKIYLLGREQVSTCRVYKWTERLDLLVEQNKWEDALSLGLDFYEGKAKAAEGLPTDFEGLHRVVGDHMSEIVEDFLDKMFRTAPENANDATAHYRKACGVCIDYSIMIERQGMLFDEVWSKFSEAGHQSVFLELLEPFMLADHLRQLAPEVLQAFVEHYQAHGRLSRVEQCLTHMDIAVIDFNQVAKLCREHELFSGLIYIFNAGCDDFVGPAEELLKAIERADATRVEPLCMRLLCYVHDCLTRSGECKRVAVHDYATSMNSLRCYLFAEADEAGSSPLLKLNMAGTLSVIAPIFDGRCTSMEDKYAEEVKRHREHAIMDAMDQGLDPPASKDVDSVPVQTCFERFAALVIDSSIPALDGQGDFAGQAAAGGFTSSDLDASYIALLKWGCYRAPDQKVTAVLLSCDLGYRLMMYLICSPQNTELLAGRRMSLLDELLRSKKTDSFDNKVVLEQLERLDASSDAQIQLGLACGYLYELLDRYDKLIESMLKTTDDTAQVFQYLEKLLDTDGDADGEARKEGVRKAFMEHMREFVTMDSKAAAALIVRHFPDHCVALVKELGDDRVTQFSFMDSLITADIEAEENGTGAGGGGLPSDLHELYLGLLCEFKPTGVLPYLRRAESARLDYCLELCQKYRIVDATAYLLERMGNPIGAMELMLSLLPERLQFFLEAAENTRRRVAASYEGVGVVQERVEAELKSAVSQLQTMLADAVALCQNNTSVWQSEAENEGLWFSLLDAFGAQQKLIEKTLPRSSSAPSDAPARTQSSASGGVDVAAAAHKQFLRLLQHILESMMIAGTVSLRKVLNKIFEDYSDMQLSDMIGMITSLLEQYTQESEVLEIARNLQSNPVNTLALYKTLAGGICVPGAAAVSTMRPKCCISGTPLHGVAASNVEQRNMEDKGCYVAASGAASHVAYQTLLSASIRKRRAATMSANMHPRQFPGRIPGTAKAEAAVFPASKVVEKKTRLNAGILPKSVEERLPKKSAKTTEVDNAEQEEPSMFYGNDLLVMLRELEEQRDEYAEQKKPERRVPVISAPPSAAMAKLRGTDEPLTRRDPDGLQSAARTYAEIDRDEIADLLG